MPIACEREIVFARGIINTRNYEKKYAKGREKQFVKYDGMETQMDSHGQKLVKTLTDI